MSGQVDVSDVPNGICYDNRTLTASFEISCGCMAERRSVLDELIAHVHGRRCQIQHPDHPGWHLIGRVTVEEKTHNLSYSAVDITAICDPWFDNDSMTIADMPIQIGSINMARFNAISPMEELSTATLGYHGESAMVFPLLSTKGTAQQIGVFKLSGLIGNHEYYVSGSLTGVGKWAAAPTAVIPDAFQPFVTSSPSGEIYIFITRLQSTGVVSLRDFICVDKDKIMVIRNTDFQTSAFCQGRPSIEEIVVSFKGTSNRLLLREQTEFLLPSGDVPALVIRAGSTAGEIKRLSWRRKKL